MTVLPVTDADVPDLKRLMDFADAILVRLAARESLAKIFTIRP